MKNTSGIQPIEFKVLVLPDPVEKKTAGGLYIPDDTHEREGWAQIKGTLVAYGGSAFNDHATAERQALKPGTRIYYNKYQGIRVTGADGEEYVLMTDKDIAAVIVAEEAAPVSRLHGRKKGGMAAA